jgi:transcriptional regulator with XRE-family HTH domain
MKLFEALTYYRKLNKVTFDELVIKTGISKSTLQKVFTGITANPAFEMVRIIAEALDVSVNDLMVATSAAPVELPPSSAAMNVARHYDQLSDQARQLISAVVLFESADVAIKNQVISILVDHANDKLQSTTSFSAAVNDLSDPTLESTAPVEEAE